MEQNDILGDIKGSQCVGFSCTFSKLVPYPILERWMLLIRLSLREIIVKYYSWSGMGGPDGWGQPCRLPLYIGWKVLESKWVPCWLEPFTKTFFFFFLVHVSRIVLACIMLTIFLTVFVMNTGIRLSRICQTKQSTWNFEVRNFGRGFRI